MKSQILTPVRFALIFPALGLLTLFITATASAEVEIDLDEATKPSAASVVKFTPTPSNASHKNPALTPTPVPIPVKKEPAAEPTPTPEPEKEIVSEAGEEEPAVEHAVSKIKNYDAGIQFYKDKKYTQAIKYLTKAVNVKDKHTPKYYYAEAYSTMGLIYQFHIVHTKKAYDCYQKALKFEKNNKTAKKYVKQVKKKLNKGK